MERRRTFKVKKIYIYENIQKSERRKQCTHSLKCNKKFSFGKILHLIQRDELTPLSSTKGQLSYQHRKSEKILHICHFKCWLRLLPFSQCSPSNPGGHKHLYPLSVNPDWQVALFWQLELLSQAFWRRKKKERKRSNGKISAQPHNSVIQICFPNGNVLFLLLFFLFKSWMHNEVWGSAEILPK